MVRKLIVSALVATAAVGLSAPAVAATVTDPIGDYISTYAGPHQADLDVTSFSVTFNTALSAFLIQSTMAGPIDPALGGLYAIGINTGTGPANFASIGFPGVTFNQVIAVQKDGTATLGGTALAPGSVTIGGNALSVLVPLALLPSTGFGPEHYGFNIWPRSTAALPPGLPGTSVISDFAPDNAILSPVPAPEPASWGLLIMGFGLVGAIMRGRAAAVRTSVLRPN